MGRTLSGLQRDLLAQRDRGLSRDREHGQQVKGTSPAKMKKQANVHQLAHEGARPCRPERSRFYRLEGPEDQYETHRESGQGSISSSCPAEERLEAGRVRHLHGLEVSPDGTRVFVCEFGNNRVPVFDPVGVLVTRWGQGPGGTSNSFLR